MTFIQCQGLAAWMATSSSHTAEIGNLLPEQRETKVSACDQVQILTDMVLGKREEQDHD